ncbi:MAG: helix-turn-helix domain-containing protein [Methylotenera sp.]|nr:helix-turn-helix domain-containing protein [Methylotenera sp.]MDO9389321.1 helix-turn-helix domain-containing protein [Methylotenera sp.]
MTTTSETTKKKGLACEANPNKPLNPNNTSINNQHQIILDALVGSPQSTIDLRHVYGIMQPAPRIKELRDMGYQIDTVRIDEHTPDNINHKGVAKYVLLGDQS